MARCSESPTAPEADNTVGGIVCESVSSVDLSEAIRIEVDAPVECVTAPSFLERVRARSPRVRAAHDDEEATTYRVTVILTKRRAQGTLVADGSEPRVLEGGSCAEVVDALAITVALAIDHRPEPSEPEPSEEEAHAPEPAPGSPTRMSSPEKPPSSLEARPTPWRPSAGVLGSLTSMGRLGSLAAPEIFVEVGPVTSHLVAPRFRLSGTTLGGFLESEGARATFRWWVGALETCPVHLHLSESLIARPCVGGQVGSLSASGLSIANGSSSRTTWVAARATAMLVLAPTSYLFLVAEAGVSIPITRRRFLFAPSEVVYTPPSVAPFAGLGAGLNFP